MKLRELYAEYFANWISGGNLVSRDKISLLGIKPLYDRFVTHNYITKVWAIRAFPVEFNKNISILIRHEMFKAHPDVKTIVHFVSEPVQISPHDQIFMKQFEAISERYHTLEEIFDSMTEDQKLAGIQTKNEMTGKKITFSQEDFKHVKDEYLSYMYIYDQATQGHTFSDTYYFIQASASSKQALKSYKKTLEGKLSELGIIFVECHGTMDAYLSNFGPAAYLHKGTSRFPHFLITDDNQTAMLPYKTKGLVGGKGVLMGLDVQSGLPFWLDFFNSGTAQINMLLGKTGCGKTYAAFSIAIWLSAMGVHFSAIDIKGGEWTKIAKYVRMLEINMGGMDSYMVNTLRLDDVQCDTVEEAMEAYDTAVRGTVGTFETCVALSPQEGNAADLHSILNKAVVKVMHTHGVIAGNANTFKRTKNLKYSDVIDVVRDLMLSKSYTENQKKICQLIITRCSDYFLSEGRYAAAMNKELTMQDIYDSPAVVYNFNKNKTVMLDALDSLRVYWVQFLDGKKQAERKRRKLHTAAFYEELQRCSQFGMLVDEISHKVTGSRSNNVIIFLLLNSVDTFNAASFAPIKSNITTKIIGKMDGEDVKKIVQFFDCAPIEDYMNKICHDQTSKYSHCFAIQYDTGVDSNKIMCKTVMPKEMSVHFNTRDRMNATA